MKYELHHKSGITEIQFAFGSEHAIFGDIAGKIKISPKCNYIAIAIHKPETRVTTNAFNGIYELF